MDLDILKKIPIFSGLSNEELGKIKELVQAARYRKGVVIFQEGDPGEAVYFIKSGKIKIYKSDEEGREYILHIFQEGDVFAEAVLLGGGSYPASAEAVEDSVVGFIKNCDLEKLISQNLQISLKIIKVMAGRLREAQEQIKNLAFRDTYDRTACLLHKICLDYGHRTTNGIEVDLPFTRQEMAALVGTSRETVTRVLSDMKKNGIIDMDRQKIIVLNEKRLMRCIRQL
ncbi:MAG: family transcriptional regulator, cyclic receptor protein [Thermoanaerobacteraceae bacterium]|jgi:CRP/FNR family transcriptional regulator|uniref:Crp/Fnr family transcriptional regulator n=1 Tax=Biomaibacter acetigenes TaxID=2316383 RepID=A0A3G2R9L1_9FIRM|nr:Crp/Fnr family transcriptional regulator [Biomaibacter acetigenes]MDK2877697.1 family transcriptional regulator, cyclic receptor protein [Thermoanaerobacteraceae bacterium]RKL64482.1 Crp/Fnr family transcriptional regulator [Thermoanaerobacteraceae bacterium SP2]AYO32095.1 Crp/Fnr family transcriptional regulator [Biomaibacter acetigenes]MDN5301158.1 family transcriptional regulator, cyclic receptor protein [Thermoanaerobacteraceae bacterium]MDN5312167.1 family transcriptional regulator, cy